MRLFDWLFCRVSPEFAVIALAGALLGSCDLVRAADTEGRAQRELAEALMRGLEFPAVVAFPAAGVFTIASPDTGLFCVGRYDAQRRLVRLVQCGVARMVRI